MSAVRRKRCTDCGRLPKKGKGGQYPSNFHPGVTSRQEIDRAVDMIKQREDDMRRLRNERIYASELDLGPSFEGKFYTIPRHGRNKTPIPSHRQWLRDVYGRHNAPFDEEDIDENKYLEEEREKERKRQEEKLKRKLEARDALLGEGISRTHIYKKQRK